MAKQKKENINDLYHQLPPDKQTELLDYAAFLVGKYKKAMEMSLTRLDIPRPEKESVIAAIKRLSKTYPMLDKIKLMDQASGILSSHMMLGKEGKVAIDELENLFAESFRAYHKS